MFLPIALALIAATSATETSTSTNTKRVKVLVLDLEAIGTPSPEQVHFVTAEVARALAEPGNLEVLTADDLRRLAALEGDKQAAGCDQTSCLAELANALGAEYVVFGTVGKIDDSLVVELSLFHAAEARAVGRRDARGAQLSELLTRIRPAVHALAGTLLPPEADPSALTPVFIAGAVVAAGGGAVVAGAGVVTLYASSIVTDSSQKAADRNSFKGIGAGAAVGVIVGAVASAAGLAILGAALVNP
jgi:hypothetical protein